MKRLIRGISRRAQRAVLVIETLARLVPPRTLQPFLAPRAIVLGPMAVNGAPLHRFRRLRGRTAATLAATVASNCD